MMANDPTNPKVVSGGDVVFEDGSAQADSLDGLVQAASGAGSVSVAADWELENMAYLAEQLVPILAPDLALPAKGIFPYIANGRIEGGSMGQQVRLTIASAIKAGVLRPFLEQQYGTELSQTGIYEATGLQNDTTPVQLAELLPYFPEFDTLVRKNNTLLALLKHPYQSLLAFPVEARPFFTGAITAAGYQTEQGTTTTWHLPLTLKDVLAYAKKVNQLPKVKEYMDILNKVKGQK